MISTLNTIPIAKQFMFQQQGYYENYHAGSPVGDYSRLIPFVSSPVNPIYGATFFAYLKPVCGGISYIIPEPIPSIERNNTITFFWPSNKESGLSNIQQGYYYIEVSYKIPPYDIPGVVNAYDSRVDADSGIVESLQCVTDALTDLTDTGYIVGSFFKTEPFWIPNVISDPERKGSFNQSFSESFDV